MGTKHLIGILTILIVPTVLGTSEAKEKRAVRTEDYNKAIAVIQQRPFLRRLRAEVAPLMGVALNETITNHFFVGGEAKFHIIENLSVGAGYKHYFGATNDLYKEIQDDFFAFPEKAIIKWYAGGNVAYVPLYGKFALFNSWVIHYDVSLIAGFGVTKTNSLHFTGSFGACSRFFVTKWLTVNWELRDYIYNENFDSGDKIQNNFVFQLGVSFFIPFGFDYQYPR